MQATERFREATLADVAALAQLRAAVWGSEAYWRERIGGYMRGVLNPQQSLTPRAVFVLEAHDQISGLIAGHLTRRFGCDGELEWLDVAAERRRRGLAARLLQMLGPWFECHSAKRVCVDVDPDNAAARAFYRKHGAEELNRHWLVWPDFPSSVRRPGEPGLP